jgi:hypothetical protein
MAVVLDEAAVEVGEAKKTLYIVNIARCGPVDNLFRSISSLYAVPFGLAFIIVSSISAFAFFTTLSAVSDNI